MICCVYDNPNTMSRECWQDGKIIYAYQANLFFIKKWNIPREKFFFGANIGNWEKGKLIGNILAMEKTEA